MNSNEKRDSATNLIGGHRSSGVMELWETTKTEHLETPIANGKFKGPALPKRSTNYVSSANGLVYERLMPNQQGTPGSSPSNVVRELFGSGRLKVQTKSPSYNNQSYAGYPYDSPSEASQAVVIDEDSGMLFAYELISEFFPQIDVDVEGLEDNPLEPPSLCTRLTRMLHRIDLCLSTPIHRLSLGFYLDCFVLVWAQVFSVWFTPLTFTVSCLFLGTEHAMTLLVAGILTPIVNSTLKGLFLRQRPNPRTLSYRFFNLRKSLKNHSFPSGDSAEAGCWSVSVALSLSSLIPLIAFPLTMFARVYYGAHYVGDTLVGASLGCSVAVLVESANYHMLDDMSGYASVDEWFHRFLIFALIPALTVPVYYFYLCAKGHRG